MSRAVIKLESIGCHRCFNRLQERLEQEMGVLSVKVFPRAARIMAECDKNEISSEMLCQLIAEQGFEIHSYFKKGWE